MTTGVQSGTASPEREPGMIGATLWYVHAAEMRAVSGRNLGRPGQKRNALERIGVLAAKRQDQT